jgi:hypothetical protein
LLDKYGGSFGKRAVAVAAAWQLLVPAWKWIQNRRRTRDYTITVGGTDELYPDLHEWVLAQIPAEGRRALLVDTSRPSRHEIAHHATERTELEVKLRYDGSRVQEVEIDGHRVEVEVMREEIGTGSSGRDLSENWRRYLERIVFTAPTQAARDAVVRMIEGLAATKYADDERSPLLMPSRWGGDWQRRSDLRPRTLESVVLRAGQAERLVADLQRFMDREEEYVRLCQPWHRGYLFYGTPGTGKTSAARALAHHFKMPVHYLPLADLERDANLMELVQQVQPRSLLLLEDVDVYHAATERDSQHDQVTLAALLNALDGVWTPHGLVTVLTTNNLDAIDEALLRAGRVDVREEFAPLDAEQIRRLVQYVGTARGVEVDEFVGRSPAELMEAIRREYEPLVAVNGRR